MSNILIIKHGSLGVLIQANGAIKDIKEFYKNRKVFLLTSVPYSIFMSECPYLDGVIIDKRLPRWNLFYLHNLKKLLNNGLMVMVNSDDPAYFGGYINKNLIECQIALNLSKENIKKLITNSFKSSFLTENKKKEWIEKI